jgi:hypothetical protein
MVQLADSFGKGHAYGGTGGHFGEISSQMVSSLYTPSPQRTHSGVGCLKKSLSMSKLLATLLNGITHPYTTRQLNASSQKAGLHIKQQQIASKRTE